MREWCWHHKYPVSWIIGLKSMSCVRALFKSGLGRREGTGRAGHRPGGGGGWTRSHGPRRPGKGHADADSWGGWAGSGGAAPRARRLPEGAAPPSGGTTPAAPGAVPGPPHGGRTRRAGTPARRAAAGCSAAAVPRAPARPLEEAARWIGRLWPGGGGRLSRSAQAVQGRRGGWPSMSRARTWPPLAGLRGPTDCRSIRGGGLASPPGVGNWQPACPRHVPTRRAFSPKRSRRGSRHQRVGCLIVYRQARSK